MTNFLPFFLLKINSFLSNFLKYINYLIVFEFFELIFKKVSSIIFKEFPSLKLLLIIEMYRQKELIIFVFITLDVKVVITIMRAFNTEATAGYAIIWCGLPRDDTIISDNLSENKLWLFYRELLSSRLLLLRLLASPQLFYLVVSKQLFHTFSFTSLSTFYLYDQPTFHCATANPHRNLGTSRFRDSATNLGQKRKNVHVLILLTSSRLPVFFYVHSARSQLLWIP